MSRRRSLLRVLAALATAACGGKSEAPPPVIPSTCPIAVAVAQPTFTAHILPALQLSCGSATATCHGTATPTGHVSFATDAVRTPAAVLADLLVAPSAAPTRAGWLRVAPGDVAHSWIVEKITKDAPGGSTTYGARMPAGAPNVCAATVQAIEGWIARNAPLL